MSLSDFQKLFPKNDRSFANIQYEENMKRSNAEKKADRNEYLRRIKEMEDAASQASEAELAAKLHAQETFRQWEETKKQVVKAEKVAQQAIRQWEQVKAQAVDTLTKAQRKYVEEMRGLSGRMKKQIEEEKLTEEAISRCTYHCQNELCWAYDGVETKDKTCPYRHKDSPYWAQATCPPVKAPKAPKRGGTRRRQRRQNAEK
jgi:hypothetical protein